MKHMRDPCYPVFISGEQAAPQSNIQKNKKTEKKREMNIHKRRVQCTEKAQRERRRRMKRRRRGIPKIEK